MYQSGPIHGPSGSGLNLLRKLGRKLITVDRDLRQLQKPLELLDRDLLGGDGEPAGDHDAPGRLVPGDSFRLGRRRPMRNSTGPSITANVCP